MIKENNESCQHAKNEKYYTCVNQTCLKKGDIKLNCHQCLLLDHPHPQALYHIDFITSQALSNQQELETLISGYLDFCQTKMKQIDSLLSQMKQSVNKLLDAQFKFCQEQIQSYESFLLEQKQQVNISGLPQKELNIILEFKHFDAQQFKKDNQLIQKLLEQNEMFFSNQLLVSLEHVHKDKFYQLSVDDLPKINLKFQDFDIQKYDICKNNHDMYMSAICLHQDCLESDRILLKCPICLTIEHQAMQGGKDHIKHIKVNKLEEEYKKRLDELENICDIKEKEIQQFFENLPKDIVETESANVHLLWKQQKAISNQGREMLVKLNQFKSKYRNESKKIYTELFLKNPYIKLADINYQSFLQNVNNFKQLFLQKKELDIQEIEKLNLEKIKKDKKQEKPKDLQYQSTGRKKNN